MSEQKFFVVGPEDSREGPFSLEELRERWTLGELTDLTMVMEAEGTAIPLGELLGPPTPDVTAPPKLEEQPAPEPMWTGTVPASTPKKSPLPVILAIVAILGCGCLGLFGAILFPVFAWARIQAQKTVNLKQMKDLSMAVTLYSADFNDRMPPAMQSAEATGPYLSAAGHPVANLTPAHKKGKFLGNESLAGKNRLSESNPQQVIMFYDTYDWDNDKAQAVAFLDGSAKYLPSARVSEATSKDFRLIP